MIKAKEYKGKTLPNTQRGENWVVRRAVDVAIREAERFNTCLVVKRGSKIQEISPKALKRKIFK